jgi:hypothetical protein
MFNRHTQKYLNRGRKYFYPVCSLKNFIAGAGDRSGARAKVAPTVFI